VAIERDQVFPEVDDLVEKGNGMRLSKEVVKRFKALLKIGSVDECWPWRGRLQRYGELFVQGVRYDAHRLSAALNDMDPIGKIVCHRCDNPGCVNPKHLFVGTQLDNVADCISKNRRGTEGARHPRPRAKITEEQVITIREEYSKGLVSIANLARRYKMSHGGISDIVHERNWVHLLKREKIGGRHEWI